MIGRPSPLKIKPYPSIFIEPEETVKSPYLIVWGFVAMSGFIIGVLVGAIATYMVLK